MADPRLQRHIETVRHHLQNLDDTPGNVASGSIASEAHQHFVTVKAAREFRDGKDAALPKSAVATWAQLIGSDGNIEPGNIESELSAWYGRHHGQEQARLSRFDQYDIMEATRPEIDSALSVWADMVCTGTIGEESRYGGGFEPQPVVPDDKVQAMLSDIAYRVNRHLLPDIMKHHVVRDMAKYGSWFEQIGLASEGGDVHVAKLQPMDIRQIRVLPDAAPDKWFGRFPPGYTEPTTTWPAWKMIHFANRKSRADTYGRSILWSCLRSWIQVEAMESGMMTRRLERASMRYKHTIDVGDTSDEKERQKRKEAYKKANTKVRTIDSSRNFQNQRITPPPSEDVIVTKRNKDSPSDVSPMQGDANLDQVADFQHFFNKLLAGLGPPKLHLGYEQDTMRSVGTELTIVFARKARRMQLALIQGLNHLYWIELLLMGIDPRSLKYVIFPPSLGTRDELVRAQIQHSHAQTVLFLAKAFAQTGKQPNTKWFLRTVMNIDDEALADLGEVDATVGSGGGSSMSGGSGGDGPSLTPSETDNMIAKLMEQPNIASELKYLRFILDERRISKMTAAQLDKIGRFDIHNVVPNFDVEAAARQLEIKELREVA